MSCRDPTDDACAVARHAEHVEGRGGSVCARGVQRASNNLNNYTGFTHRATQVGTALVQNSYIHVVWHTLYGPRGGGAERSRPVQTNVVSVCRADVVKQSDARSCRVIANSLVE